MGGGGRGGWRVEGKERREKKERRTKSLEEFRVNR